jgi:hypothetical protein
MSAEPEGLAHALVELSRQGERLSVLDTREAEHFRQIGERLGALGTALTNVEATVGEQRTALEELEELSGQVTRLAAKLGEIVPDDDGKAKVYRPGPAPRWWKLKGEERDEALAKLKAWVEQIYRPLYGHLATLGPCWHSHPLCLVTLDWLSELWSVLYLQDKRNASVLAGQAEFQTRLLPAAAEQLATETARCQHAQPRNGQRAAMRR